MSEKRKKKCHGHSSRIAALISKTILPSCFASGSENRVQLPPGEEASAVLTTGLRAQMASRRVAFPSDATGESSSQLSKKVALVSELWAVEALRTTLYHATEANRARWWQGAGHGVARIDRETLAASVESLGLGERKMDAFMEALDTVLGFRWPASLGTLTDLVAEATASLSRGAKPTIVELTERFLRPLEDEGPSVIPVARPGSSTSFAAGPSRAPSRRGPSDPALAELPARDPEPWRWGLAADETLRPEIRAIQEAEAQANETAAQTMERRRRERAESRKKAAAAREARAMQGGGAAGRGRKGAPGAPSAPMSHTPSRAAGPAANAAARPGVSHRPKDPQGGTEKKAPRPDSSSCRVIGQSAFHKMPPHYVAAHGEVDARDGQREARRRQAMEEWARTAGRMGLDDLLARHMDGKEPGSLSAVVMRSFDKRAVTEVRGGSQWRAWPHPDAVKGWSRVAGGFAPIVKRGPEPEPPDAVYTWVTTDGDSLDLRSVADQIRDTSDQVDGILDAWGASPLYLRYLQLLGDMRREDGLHAELRATPLAASSGAAGGVPDRIMVDGVDILVRTRSASEVSLAGSLSGPSLAALSSRPGTASASMQDLAGAARGSPGLGEAKVASFAAATGPGEQDAWRGADEAGRVGRVFNGGARAGQAGDAFVRGWPGRGDGGAHRGVGVGRMTVDEASVVGTRGGQLARAVDLHGMGTFREGLGRDRMQLEPEHGTQFWRVSVPAGWGELARPRPSDEAGHMSLAAHMAA